MDNTSQTSSHNTKPKKSFIGVITKFFRKSKSAQTSKVTFNENAEKHSADSSVVSLVNKRIEEESNIQEVRTIPHTEIELVETVQIHRNEPKNEEVYDPQSESEFHMDLNENEKEEAPVINKNIETIVNIEQFETQSRTTIVSQDINEIDANECSRQGSSNYLEVLPIEIDKRYAGQEFTEEQLPHFCEQLHNLLGVLRNVQANCKSLAKYPRDLQKMLENDSKELELIYAEMRCVKATIEQIKKQRELISTGKLEAMEQLTILENEEFEEIEKSINIHDTPIYKSWEKTKRSKTPESFERLIKDIHSNQEALKNLEVLVKNRKAKINYMNKRFRSVSGPTNNNTIAVMPTNVAIPVLGPQNMA